MAKRNFFDSDPTRVKKCPKIAFCPIPRLARWKIKKNQEISLKFNRLRACRLAEIFGNLRNCLEIFGIAWKSSKLLWNPLKSFQNPSNPGWGPWKKPRKILGIFKILRTLIILQILRILWILRFFEKIGVFGIFEIFGNLRDFWKFWIFWFFCEFWKLWKFWKIDILRNFEKRTTNSSGTPVPVLSVSHRSQLRTLPPSSLIKYQQQRGRGLEREALFLFVFHSKDQNGLWEIYTLFYGKCTIFSAPGCVPFSYRGSTSQTPPPLVMKSGA